MIRNIEKNRKWTNDTCNSVMHLTYFGRYIIKDRRYIEKEYRISNKNKNTVDYYDAWIKDNKGNVISIDIEKIPKEYIIDGLRNI